MNLEEKIKDHEIRIIQNREDIIIIKVKLDDIQGDTQKILDKLENGIGLTLLQLKQFMDEQKKESTAIKKNINSIEQRVSSLEGGSGIVQKILPAIIGAITGALAMIGIKLASGE